MKRYSCQLSVVSCQTKKLILLVTSYCLLVTLVIGCAKREIKNIDSRGKNIICYGDSVTWGYGVSPGEDYPCALSEMTDIPVINAGLDGDTSVEALNRIDTDVIDRDPLLVIIEFGGNDFLRKIPSEVTTDNIREMIDRIQAKGAMVAIADISTGAIMNDYRLAFYRISRETGSIFIPYLLSGIVTNPKLKSDFLHPNRDGYRLFAQRVYRAITPYLKKNNLARK